MDNNICATCSFWTRGQGDGMTPQNSEHFGDCSHPAFIYLPDSVAPVQRHDSFLYWDAEDYEASFVTGEKFGCIHHSIKPKKNQKE